MIAQPEPGCQLRLKVFVEQKHVDRAYEGLYQDLAGRGDIPGFRKGKVPVWRIRREFGEDVIDSAIYIRLLEVALRGALTYGDLQPTQPADFGDDEDEERGATQGQPLETEALLAVRPDVRVPDYEGIELEAPDGEPTEEQIEAELKSLQDAVAELIEVDRAEVQAGDQVEIVLRTKVEGEESEPEQRDESLIVGEDRYDPSLDQHILGHSVGETVEFTVEYPDRPSMGDLAGKKVEMSVDIKGLRERKVPELDEEFANKAIEGCETVEALREEVTKRVRERSEELAGEIMRGQAARWLGDNVRIDLPESLVATAEEFDADEAESANALRLVRIAIACDTLLEERGVEVSDEELREAYIAAGASQGVDPSLLAEEAIIPEVASVLRDRLVREKGAEMVAKAATKKVVPLSELGAGDEDEEDDAESAEGSEESTEEQEDE